MSQSGFDTKLVKDLARILRDTDLSEIEVENEGVRVRVARQASVTPQLVHAQVPVASAPVAAMPAAPAPAAAAAAAPADPAKHPGAVASPMVGTVYTQPEPGASAFIKVGDTVKEGQQLFIIEAMKTMNPVPSPRSGTVTAILVHDAQPVEYGEALCVIE
ncbi:MAG: acetyl-CoA carboxylase biotin carboxyl carrier protein [Hyphomonadaceae bacterium]|jgi:acetyl-CoA carboxylase biotin carboxyl carrier protein|uniref:acetyl-CoA carboxylase biotin carboxyl carrier protein n=1 Tax=Aquidulcibacter sp. TaxID=2052990 RepID=UPI0022C88347|nr:acetyl-CoA carboxylase biotin carboxyl carrier protein [Aquidulcibacter sp.]MCE2892430.1 acetyl-CoA carboxylase biotin carboxyl carrier protein [Hyphomonadaceae bacterium]MCZ8207583.1 acetyl-CoA carboxylase biotin carboxyl carrier protein [Aquidulcibacter sp.]